MVDGRSPSIHASAVLIGARAVLIRGPAGSGKSRLIFALLQAGGRSPLSFVRLVADDRTIVEAAHGRLLARPVPELAGLLEVHGLGIRRVPFEPVAVVSHVIDIAADDAARLPEKAAESVIICSVKLPRIVVAANCDPLPLLLAAIGTEGVG
jgi:HPr kinase/phosphorylase